MATQGGDHGGADYYTLYHVVEALRGNRNADVIDVYEAMDMGLPGLRQAKESYKPDKMMVKYTARLVGEIR